MGNPARDRSGTDADVLSGSLQALAPDEFQASPHAERALAKPKSNSPAVTLPERGKTPRH
jgi:hypothetical protein